MGVQKKVFLESHTGTALICTTLHDAEAQDGYSQILLAADAVAQTNGAGTYRISEMAAEQNIIRFLFYATVYVAKKTDER